MCAGALINYFSLVNLFVKRVTAENLGQAEAGFCLPYRCEAGKPDGRELESRLH